MGHGIFVIAEVLLISGLDLFMQVLHLHKYQRDTIHKSDQIGTTTVDISLDPQLAHYHKVVVVGLFKIEDTKGLALTLTLIITITGQHTAFVERVLLLIDRQQRLGQININNLAHRIPIGLSGKAGIQVHQRLTQVTTQHQLLFALASQSALFSQGLIHGVDGIIPVQVI